jgi:hypothetical protein
MVKEEAPSEAPSSQPSRQSSPDDPEEEGDAEEAPPASQPADADEVHPIRVSLSVRRKDLLGPVTREKHKKEGAGPCYHILRFRAKQDHHRCLSPGDGPEEQSQVQILDLAGVRVAFSLGSGLKA